MFDARVVDADGKLSADQVDFTARQETDQSLKIDLQAINGCPTDTSEVQVALTAVFCGDEADLSALAAQYIPAGYTDVSISISSPTHTADNDTSGLGQTGLGGSHDNDELGGTEFQAIDEAPTSDADAS